MIHLTEFNYNAMFLRGYMARKMIAEAGVEW